MKSEIPSVREGWNILQIIPAREGFAAVYGSETEGDYIFMQVVCLALVEDQRGDRFVTGLDDDLEFCSDSIKFCNYINLDNIEQINKKNESQLTPVI